MTAHDDYVAGASFELQNPNGSGVIILLHGLGADRNQPLELIKRLRRGGLAVLAADARAHGSTSTIGEPADFRLDGMAADVAALANSVGQGGKPTHLVGISMGAAVALRAALNRSFDLQSLTLVRPAFTTRPLPANLRVMAKIGEALLAPDVTLARTAFEDSPEYREVAAVSALGAASLLSQFAAPYARERSVRLREVPLNSAYENDEPAGIDVPTLVIGTEHDPVHPLSIAQEWHRQIDGSRLEIVPPRDEFPTLSAARTAKLVVEHLERVAQAPVLS